MVIVVWMLYLQLPVQSLPSTTKGVCLDPADGKMYSIQHYVIKFVSDFRKVNGFLRVSWFPPSIKLSQYNWNIVESGIKYHNPKPNPLLFLCSTYTYTIFPVIKKTTPINNTKIHIILESSIFIRFSMVVHHSLTFNISICFSQSSWPNGTKKVALNINLVPYGNSTWL